MVLTRAQRQGRRCVIALLPKELVHLIASRCDARGMKAMFATCQNFCAPARSAMRAALMITFIMEECGGLSLLAK